MAAIGHLLRAPFHATEPPTAVYYSPWYPRAGNLAVFQCDVIAFHGIESFSIDVQTKNSEDDDAVGNNASNKLVTQAITLTANTRTPITAGSSLGAATDRFEELYRFKISLQAQENTRGGFVHWRMLNPSWLSN